MTTRTGKIARLPRAIRDQLNQRLDDGEQGPELLAWLNGLHEVREILARDFEGKEINAQNLSAWRQGGFQDWVTQGQVLELVHRLKEETADLRREEVASGHPLTGHLLQWLTARYLLASRQLDQLDGAEAWKRLRGLCADLGRLRRMEEEDRRRREAEEGKNSWQRMQLADLLAEMRVKNEEARRAKEQARQEAAAKAGTPGPEEQPQPPAGKETPPIQAGESRCWRTATPPEPNPEGSSEAGAMLTPSLAQSTQTSSENPAILAHSR